MNKLQIDLTVEEIHLVVDALSRLPYCQVANLIAAIEAQAGEQMPGWSEDETLTDESLNQVP